MGDYGININTNDYLYKRPVYYTNPLNQDREDVIIKMVLNSTNFNFSLAKADLGDLRVAERDNGTYVLRMWVAYLEVARPFASIYLKLPSILANQTVTLWVFFGNASAIEIKEPDKIGFLFYETFDTTPSSSKWSGDLTSGLSVLYGYDLTGSTYMFYAHPSVGVQGIINTITNPLSGKSKWILEAGTYLASDYINGYWLDARGTQSRSYAFSFTGSENAFGIQYLATVSPAANPGISNDAVLPRENYTYSAYAPWEVVWGVNYGPEPFSYQENFVAYNEPQDIIYQCSYDRKTLPDIDNTIYRRVNGETKISNVSILGYFQGPSYFGSGPVYMSWFILREFDVSYRVLVDCRDLYTTLQGKTVNHELLNYKEYGDDITNVIYKHESSFGGDPLLLSDDLISTTWVSGVNATLESEIGVTIFFYETTDLTNFNYTHYDSGHVKYFGASKLSDTNEDVWGRDFWDCPTSTNSWAAIKFDSLCVINSCSITAVSEDLNCCPKNYVFFGSNYSPVTAMYKAVELYSGAFSKIATTQQFFFHNKAEYKYYILYVLGNYGGSNIRIQEWEMFYLSEKSTKKRVSQLRLLPPADELLYSFPNEISLQASVDMLAWDTLIPWTQTYSPWMQHYVMYGYWQHYSFEDPTEKGYYAYRLLCRGNWGEVGGRIAIKEWEMRELYKEYETYRILEGTTNIISQIWVSEGCGIDDSNGTIYATNDKLNYIMNDSVSSTSLPSNYNDINVIQGV